MVEFGEGSRDVTRLSPAIFFQTTKHENTPMKTTAIITALFLAFFMIAGNAQEIPVFTTLNGSPDKVEAAFQVAEAHNLTPARDAEHVGRFVQQGLLLELSGNGNYVLCDVSFPYARPAGKLFVERFSKQYRAAGHGQLAVTSIVRPIDQARWNSSPKTVHPRGIAIDFRIPKSEAACSWMESNLLLMQSRGLVIAVREHNPPHFHVVVIPSAYQAYVQKALTAKK